MYEFISPVFIQQVITCSIIYQNYSIANDFFTFYKKNIDWNNFLNFLIKNKSIPAFLEVVEKGEIDANIPFYILEFLSRYSDILRAQKEYYEKEIVQIHDRFMQENIDYRLVKGLALERSCYKNNDIKQISDLDIIVNEKDSEKVQKIYSELGYVPGKFDCVKRKIKHHDRQKNLLLQLTNDHLPDYVKIIDKSPKIALIIDTTINVNWNRTKNILLDPFDSIAYVDIDNRNIRTLDDVSHITYLISHLYKHGNSNRLIERNSGLRFSMFADVFTFINHCQQFSDYKIISKVSALCRLLNLENDYEWVMTHMNSIFISGFDKKNVSELVDEYFEKNNEFLENRLTAIYEKDVLN